MADSATGRISQLESRDAARAVVVGPGRRRPLSILLIAPYFPPLNRIGALRTHAFARDWAASGANVTVLTTVKREDQKGLVVPRDGFRVVELDYSPPAWVEALRQSLLRFERDQAVSSRGSTRGVSRFGWRTVLDRLRKRYGIYSSVRMPDLTDRWVGKATEWARANGPWDVAVSSAGPYTAHRVALEVKRSGHTQAWVADFRDLWVGNAFRGLFPFTALERRLERLCFEHADLLVTVSDGLRSALERAVSRPDLAIEVITNGFDPDEIAGLPAEPAFPGDGRIRLVYTGTLYRQQDPSVLFQAIRLLRDRGSRAGQRLSVVAAGRWFEDWSAHAERAGVPDALDFRGEVSRQDSLRMQRDAQGLVFLDWNGSDGGVLTGKIYEYLAGRPPILLVGEGQVSGARRLVETTGRGVVVGGSADRAAGILEDLGAEGSLASRLRPRMEHIAQYTRRRQSLRLLRRIEESCPAAIRGGNGSGP